MTRSHPCRRLLAMILVATGAVWAPTARSQIAPPGPGAGADAGSHHAAAASVSGACRAEIARLCTTTGAAAPQGRSAALCLKPFKTSLSLPCRKAVRGVFG